jgi:low affinity Fe/Cu permease
MAKRDRGMGSTLERLSGAMTAWAGSSAAFGCAAGVIVLWAALGPVFGYSNTWQLVINTGTTVVTFLMVFLIQRSQNKDALAIHVKLNELVAALEGASNRLIDVESLSEQDLRTLEQHFATLAKLAGNASHIAESHSVEEADRRHAAKFKGSRRRDHAGRSDPSD